MEKPFFKVGEPVLYNSFHVEYCSLPSSGGFKVVRDVYKGLVKKIDVTTNNIHCPNEPLYTIWIKTYEGKEIGIWAESIKDIKKLAA